MHANSDDIVPGLKALYLAFATEHSLPASAAFTRMRFLQDGKVSLQMLRGSVLLRRVFCLEAEHGPEMLVHACGALYYAKALARTIRRDEVQAVRNLIGTALYSAVLKGAAGDVLPPYPLPADPAAAILARGQAIVLAGASDLLLQKALIRRFGPADDAFKPETNVAARILGTACACVFSITSASSESAA